MRVLYCGSGWLSMVDRIRDGLGAGYSVSAWDRTSPLGEVVGDVDVLLPSNAPATADIIARAAKLKLIQQPAAGVDGIDIAAAHARGIPVCNAPSLNDRSVSEAAVLLMLAVARKLPAARRGFEAAVIGEPPGMELAGKRICLVGRGATARAVAQVTDAIGMIGEFVHSKTSRADALAAMGRSDVISIHVPLTDSTRGMFDAEMFAHMKPGAIVVNCSRGPVLDRAALEAALDTHAIGGVGLDVYWDEPWDPSDPLFSRDDVVTLPHIAGSTVEAFARIADIVCTNVRRVARGEPPLCRVKP